MIVIQHCTNLNSGAVAARKTQKRKRDDNADMLNNPYSMLKKQYSMDTKRANMAFQGLKKQYLMSSEPRQEGETQEEFDHRMERKSLKETGIDRDITQIIFEDLNAVKTLNLGAFITKLIKNNNIDISKYNIKDNFVPYDLKIHFHNEKDEYGFNKAYVSGLPKIFYEITSGLPKIYYEKTIGTIPDKIDMEGEQRQYGGHYSFYLPDAKTPYNNKDIDMDNYDVTKVFFVDGFILVFSLEYSQSFRAIDIDFRLFSEEGSDYILFSEEGEYKEKKPGFVQHYPRRHPNYFEMNLTMDPRDGFDGEIFIKGFDELFS